MKIFWLLIISQCGLLLPGLSAQDYLWPTDASQWMTSSFAEYRPRRFHAAIDIKTWNKSGYKIFAVRDGYVQRIRVSPFGYGKAIYLKLDTGETVVYAHLSGFNEALERVVRREQQKNLRYRVDRYFSASAFPVKKGDFLGYTGETGIGVPHLHFEMRDSKNRPINPLSKGYVVKDNVPPIPRRVAFIPLSYGARINEDFKPYILPVKKLGRGRYRIEETVSFEGEIGIALSAFDMTDGVRNKFNVYALEMRVDGRPWFASQYDRFSYSQNKYIELDRDYRLTRRNQGRFYRLFLDPANKLSYYTTYGEDRGRLIFRLSEAETKEQGDLPAGSSSGPMTLPPSASPETRTLSAGVHDVQITIRDFFGNSTTIEAKVIAGKKQRIVPRYAVDDSLIMLSALTGAPAGGEIQLSLKSGRKWLPISPLEQRLPQAGDPVALIPRAEFIPGRIFRLVVTNAAGLESWPEYLINPDQPKKPLHLELERDFYDDYLRVLVKSSRPLKKAPLLEITRSDGSTIYPDLFRKGPARYTGIVPLRDISGHGVRITAFGESLDGETGTAETVFDNFHVVKNRRSVVQSPDGAVQVQFTRNSLYRDIYCRIYQLEEPRRGDRSAVSPVYRAEPGDVPLSNTATVSFFYADTTLPVERLGVYYRNSKGKWIFIDNKLDKSRNRVSAAVFSLEDFALRIDDQPPVVTINRPRKKHLTTTRPLIRITAKDEQSGFASEESLLLRINGRKVVAEYDPELDWIQYTPHEPLAAGEHRIEFTATDRSGNVTKVSRTFTIGQ
ncbi:MAG TPA: M23 family metallopeptidase [Bacteroidetes bacterium]|nr:M23 family metallopeptidase [Bacteroidota bacterium]